MHYKPHTWSTESSSECSSLFHSPNLPLQQAEICQGLTHGTREQKYWNSHGPPLLCQVIHHEEDKNLKGRALTGKSKAWEMERSLLTWVLKLLWCQILPHGFAFTSSPQIALLSLKIWVRMIRFQPKKSTACEYRVQTTVCRLNCCRAGAPTFSSLLTSESQSLKREPQSKSSWKGPLDLSSSSFCPKQG